MIVGKGDIGKALIEAGVDRADTLFFASGVSDSREERDEEYKREMDLFDGIYGNENGNLHRVYFSSLSIYYANSRYAKHKTAMEERITWGKWTHTILRIGNITWGTNPNTIINYFKSCYEKGVQLQLQDAYRHLVTKEEFIYWIKLIRPGMNDVMNIPGEMVHVKEIWRRVINGYY